MVTRSPLACAGMSTAARPPPARVRGAPVEGDDRRGGVLPQEDLAYDTLGGVAVVELDEALPERGTQRGGPLVLPGTAAEDLDELVLVGRRGARGLPRLLGEQVEVDAAGLAVDLPVVHVGDDGPVQAGVVEHDRRVVRDQRVGGQAEILHHRVLGHVLDQTAVLQGLELRVGVVEVVRAYEEDEVGAEFTAHPLQVDPGHEALLVVPHGRAVQQGGPALLDTQLGADARDVLRGRPEVDVVARVAGVDRLEGAGVDALPDLGRVLVGGEAVVPAVHPFEHLAEAHALRGGGEPLLVDAHLLQRRAVVGLQMDLPRPLDDLVGEVGVVDEVLRPGDDLPVAGRTLDHVVDPRGHVLLLARAHDPHAVDVRGEFLRLLEDRGGVAGHATVPVGAVDREVLVDRAAQVHLVELVVRLPAQPGLDLGGTLAQLRPGGAGEDGGHVRGVGAALQEIEPQPGPALGLLEAGGLEPLVLLRRPLEEGGAVLGKDAVLAGERE